MEKDNIKNFYRGWFIGNFEPSLFKTNDFEVAFKEYKKGEVEDLHVHKIATEYTFIVKGRVEMNNEIFEKGDIITILPNESTLFKALEDSETFVVKTPFAKNDKYIL